MNAFQHYIATLAIYPMHMGEDGPLADPLQKASKDQKIISAIGTRQMTVAQLAMRVDVCNSTLKARLYVMRDAGIVNPIQSRTNTGRQVLWELTDKGMAMFGARENK